MDADILDTIDLQELGRRLQLARKQSGLTQAEAAERINSARTTITAIEKGERRIRADELIKLARAYGRQVSEFVRPRPLLEPFVVQFRSSYHRTYADEEKIVAYIEQFETLCQDYLELEQIVGAPLTYKYPPVQSIAGLPLERAAESMAHSERARLGLGDGPIPPLRELLEQDVGLRIFYIDMKPQSKFSAMYTYSEQFGGAIAVNRLHPEERRRYSLAHDYAHFLAHRYKAEVLGEDTYERQPESERFADYFAMYFLMPSTGLVRRHDDMVRSRAKKKFTLADLYIIAHYYGVSVEAMTLRLEGLRLLPTGTFERLRNSGNHIRKDQEALELKQVQAANDVLPKRYQILAAYAFAQGLITEGQLARFLRVDRLEARQITSSLQEETNSMFQEILPNVSVELD